MAHRRGRRRVDAVSRSRGPTATLYLPAAQMLDVAQTLAVRTTAAPALVASLVRERIRAIDANVHVMSVVPFARALDAPLARPRFNAFLLNLFGAAALFLAGIGQYAVIAAYVRQREREIALRVALGASPANVRWLVLAEALRLAGHWRRHRTDRRRGRQPPVARSAV